MKEVAYREVKGDFQTTKTVVGKQDSGPMGLIAK